MERLDKFLCDCGVGTRNQVKDMIKSGRITVDGKPEKDNGRKIQPETQQICLDGQALGKVGTVVLMLNKPAGYVTATEDARDKTVMELIPEPYRRMDVKPVGRLDKQTEGLLLFTNDGDLLHKLISPKWHVEKVYYARHPGQAQQEDIAAFAQGIVLADGTQCLPAKLQPLGPGESLITLQEGKYHQVRRMMASRQMPVEYLERRQEGPLVLGQLPRGEVREVSAREIETILAMWQNHQ